MSSYNLSQWQLTELSREQPALALVCWGKKSNSWHPHDSLIFRFQAQKRLVANIFLVHSSTPFLNSNSVQHLKMFKTLVPLFFTRLPRDPSFFSSFYQFSILPFFPPSCREQVNASPIRFLWSSCLLSFMTSEKKCRPQCCNFCKKKRS